VPEAIVGAGTCAARPMRGRQGRRLRFGVSPGYTSRAGRACRDIGLPLLPGVATASEVMAAMADGLRFLKFFPATAAGGIPMLKALAGPFPDVAFCPTGGITPETAPQFLALPNVKVCGGSWLTPQDAVDAGDWARITRWRGSPARAARARRAPRAACRGPARRCSSRSAPPCAWRPCWRTRMGVT
jgi:2-dehydro-3-deoxyphosphogluconate aldolase / (4S)-4-hydroxy-2-oxoglutarate aldolase